MLGTIVNCGAIMAGCIIGMLFKQRLSTKVSATVFSGLGLCTLYIGISGAITGTNTLVIIISMVIGGALGEAIDIDAWLAGIGKNIEARINHGTNNNYSIAQGFISASLLFCVGAMTILGSLQSGINHDYSILYAKSALDFVSATIYSSTMGIGVGLAAVFVLIYQGTLTLLAGYIAPYLSDVVITQMNAVGSLIIIGLALNMLNITKLKVANFIPAIFLPIIIYLFI